MVATEHLRSRDVIPGLQGRRIDTNLVQLAQDCQPISTTLEQAIARQCMCRISYARNPRCRERVLNEIHDKIVPDQAVS